VVLLHGFGATLETWNDIEPLLCPRWKVVRADLKGFGLSSKPRDGSYTIFDQAAVVLGLVRALDLQDYVLAGHSFGGTVAMTSYLAFGREKSTRVRSLVLIGSPCYMQPFPPFIRLLSTPFLNHVVQMVPPARFRAAQILRRIFQDKTRVTPERINRYAKYFNLPGIHHSLIESARQIVPSDPDKFSARIREVTVPTLIVWGQNDNVVPLWQGERLRRDIGSARLEVLPNCGHMPHEERPDDVARLLADFVGCD
jgi:pimeloyl-ACP methyl ester carboxylesterase